MINEQCLEEFFACARAEGAGRAIAAFRPRFDAALAEGRTTVEAGASGMAAHLEREQFFVVSTGHMRESDDHRLAELSWNPLRDDPDLDDPIRSGLWVAAMPHGYMIRLPAEPQKSLLEDVLAAGLSEAVGNLVLLAAVAGADFLKFDRDGLELDEMPSFDW